MSEPNLLSLSVSAFAAVLLLLSLLALAIRALTMIFAAPAEPTHGVDASVVAALSTAVHHALPGYRVTRIEEKS